MRGVDPDAPFTLFVHHPDGRMLTGHEGMSTSRLLEDFRFLTGLEPSFSSCSARLLPSSRACRRSKAVKAPPPPLGKSSSFAGAGTAIASEDLFITIGVNYLLQQCANSYQSHRLMTVSHLRTPSVLSQ